MANEITPSAIADLMADEVVSTEFLMLLAARDGSVLTHPAWFYAQASAPNSNVVRVPHVGLGGYNLMTDHTPGAEKASTALTTDATEVTIAPKSKVYTLDDFAGYLAAGMLGKAKFAEDLAITYAQTLIDVLANIGDDFTDIGGNAGSALTWADVIDTKTQLAMRDVTGALLAELHPEQWGDLEVDTLSLGFAPALTLNGVINKGLESAKGNYGSIDFFTSTRVPTSDAGVNHAGCILGRGGIAWADAPLPAVRDSFTLGRARLEEQRRSRGLMTDYTFACIIGAAKAIDNAGQTVKSRVA
jgi:hypothetical protein